MGTSKVVKDRSGEKVITIRFGATAPSITEQVRDQGFMIERQEGARLNACKDAVTQLYLCSALTDGEKNKVTGRLFKQIMLAVKPEPVGGAY